MVPFWWHQLKSCVPYFFVFMERVRGYYSWKAHTFSGSLASANWKTDFLLRDGRVACHHRCRIHWYDDGICLSFLSPRPHCTTAAAADRDLRQNILSLSHLLFAFKAVLLHLGGMFLVLYTLYSIPLGIYHLYIIKLFV